MIIPVMLVSSLVFSDFRSEWLGVTFWLSMDIADSNSKARFETLDLFGTVCSSNWLWYVFVSFRDAGGHWRWIFLNWR